MSNFMWVTKHPKTGKEEMAEWLDNYYGSHEYGVRFPSDGEVFREEDIERMTLRNNYPKKIYLQIEDGEGNISKPDDLYEYEVTWSEKRINKSDIVYKRCGNNKKRKQ